MKLFKKVINFIRGLLGKKTARLSLYSRSRNAAAAVFSKRGKASCWGSLTKNGDEVREKAYCAQLKVGCVYSQEIRRSGSRC